METKDPIEKILNLNPTLSKNKEAYIVFISDIVEEPLKIAPMGLFNSVLELLNDPRSEIKIFKPEHKNDIAQLLASLHANPEISFTLCYVQLPHWFDDISPDEIANLKEKQKNPFNFPLCLSDIYGTYFSNEPEAAFFNMDGYPHALCKDTRIEGIDTDNTIETLKDNFWTTEARMLAKCRKHRYGE